MQHSDLYSIGDVARRTGLAVSAIRFYSDEGIVRPAGVDQAGRRRYDLRAVAQLELIRTLRELGTGLTDIRSMLAGTASLRDVLRQHLTVVDRREQELRARRAVLRSLSRLDDPSTLMREIVAAPDEENGRVADEPAGLLAAYRSGLPPDSPDVRKLVDDLVREDAAGFGAWLSAAVTPSGRGASPHIDNAQQNLR